MKTGRVTCLLKQFPGHLEHSNPRVELHSLAKLNAAHQDPRKVRNLQNYCLVFFLVVAAIGFPDQAVLSLVQRCTSACKP